MSTEYSFGGSAASIVPTYTFGGQEAWFDPLESADDTRATKDASHEVSDGSLQITTKFSEPISFNTLHVPELQVSGDYNYYVESELNSEYNERKDIQQPNDAPMYIKLQWSPVVSLLDSSTILTTLFHGIEVDGIDKPSVSEIAAINNELKGTTPVIILK